VNLKPKWQMAGVFTAQGAKKLIVRNDAPATSTRSVMGLKKRSGSKVERGQPSTECYKRSQLAACGTEHYTKKGLGFFGHVAGQASGWSQTVERQQNTHMQQTK
jgi:hypothetical protein